jgi:hypothetical protein
MEIETELSNSRKDIDRVGLSEAGANALEIVMQDGHFKDKIACYRFAVALALKEDIDISNHNVVRPTGHMYLQSQIDPDGIFATAIAETNPRYKSIKYRALERYADLGIQLLASKLNAGEHILYWVK